MNNVDSQKVSLESLRTLSGLNPIDNTDENLTELENYDERKWRLSHLKNQFESLELNKLFKLYTDKINFGYFSLFLILIFLLSLTHFFIVLFSSYQDDIVLALPDIILYLLQAFFCLIGLIFIDRLSDNKWKHLPKIYGSLLFFVNFFIPLYHTSVTDEGKFVPAYTVVLIISCYVFFCIHENWKAFTLATFVTVAHLFTLIFSTYNTYDVIWKRVTSDLIFFICLNALGLYFRYMNEIVKRRSFLDRRDCILSMLQLQHEKDQEEDLMSSIIPKNLIDKVKEQYLEKLHYLMNKQQPFKSDASYLLTEHENVTILFADIVHYTEMTTKLNISDLLETLNELFGRFDDASDKFGVVRIKFLGDCYYCVSGLPSNSPPNPAEACVDLGLKMINIIAKVRRERNLTVNMRIGIHTGKIISGIIGAVKYQYDIWSKDVDIANKMESEGVAGKVHITEQTKNFLTKNYDIEITNKGETVPQFKQNNIKTYLVSPKSVTVQTELNENRVYEQVSDQRQNQPRTSIFRKNGYLQHLQGIEDSSRQPSIIEEREIELAASNNGRRGSLYRRRASNSPMNRNRISEERRITADMKRRTAFMNHNIKRYVERSTAVNQEMQDTINNMSFSKKEQYTKVDDISSLLFFKNFKNELDYIKQPDPLFKYYIISQIIILFCIYFIQNITLTKWESDVWQFVVIQVVLIFVLLPLTWTNFIWNRFIKDYVRDSEPRNVVVRFFYKTSKNISENFVLRHFIYTLVYLLYGYYILKEMIDCEEVLNSKETYDEVRSQCILPWQITECSLLAIIMTFVFLKMFVWVKLLFATVITIVYSCCLVSYTGNYYNSSESTNYMVESSITHILSVVFLTVTLHFIDRQTDYMNRLDFLWNTKLLSDQVKATEQQLVNKNLLLNILPKHVAEKYLDVNREMNDLYHEDHSNVAVMFASIIIDEDIQNLSGQEFLRLMNEYITAFDTLINRPEYSSVEKIKIAKWTYMAACGLVAGGKAPEIERHATSSTLNILVNFAADMFRQIAKVNGKIFNCNLRIGICHGPIVAGVVGSKKPLYDIWGDPVNMASRMDSTGVIGKIQVMEATARILMDNLGFQCEYRGPIEVKGRKGLVNTYFVKLDDNFKPVRAKSD